jgi:hypothetical protein
MLQSDSAAVEHEIGRGVLVSRTNGVDCLDYRLDS